MSIDYTPTTELEAVNAILAASNEAPIATLPSNRPDVALAQAALAAALRETMATRWRFNSDVNYRLDGTVQSGAFVYPEPANLLRFTVTPTEAQRGLDIVSRPSRTYLPGGSSVRILANRVGGLDTLTQSELFINPVWSVPFALAPEAARRYITLAAVRRRVQQLGYEKQLEAAAADEQASLAALKDTESPVGAAVLSDGWATELDALNTILAMAGQQPIASTLEAEDVSLRALNGLRQATTDTCSMGWRFNTETGYGITPEAVVFSWLDVDDTAVDLLIYLAPARLLSATPTNTLEQSGAKAIDPIIRVAERYNVSGVKPTLIYDRANHRDGFPQADRTIVWLDVVWRKPFDEMPEEARHYATVVAGRRFCASFGNTPRWSEQDEMMALRSLQRSEGKRSTSNFFRDNVGALGIRGRRSVRDPFVV